MEGLQLTLQIPGLGARAGRAGAPLGEVFTRRWVVELILDLVGYTVDRDLGMLLAVEPACGGGAFLGPMVERLIGSTRRCGRALESCTDAIRGFDVSPANVELARKTVVAELVSTGMNNDLADELAQRWVTVGDFLLVELPEGSADFVIGNPPYVRLEDLPASLNQAYRRACKTMRGRSDLYVGFIERALRLLSPSGVLGFIVADRWMHNQYGAGLRFLVSTEFAVDTVIEMHDADAFDDAVSAYPAITVIRRAEQSDAVLAVADKHFDAASATQLYRWAAEGGGLAGRGRGYVVQRLPGWFPGDELWPTGDPETVALVKSLEERFPALEDLRTGTRVGIGVATGADDVYLTRDEDAVETERLLPLAMSQDTATGQVEWSGTYLINPWEEGGLVDLAKYPKLRLLLEHNEQTLRRRHVAKRRPDAWYRTIDRVWPDLAAQRKLLLPDMKARIHPVLESGGLYPHHNLYFVVSQGWDLEVLGGILLSDFSDAFVGTYCVKMRGGCLRFQAQYLRKIRVPTLASVNPRHQRSLRQAFRSRDRVAATRICAELFGIDTLPSRWQTS